MSALALSLFLSACASPGIVEVSPGQYMLAKRDPGGLVWNTAALKAKIIREANAFAESKGKRAAPVPLVEIPGWPSCDPLLVEYHFRTVDPSQAAAFSRPSAPGVTKLSAELLKLDELRQRGVLTQSEFDERKQRLLRAN